MIAILSDSHDNRENLIMALAVIIEKGAKQLLFCGDFCSPKMLRVLGEHFKNPTHVVFGNNDGDRFALAANAASYPHVTLHGEYAALEIDHKRIGMTHYPFYATAMAKSADYDLVAFGHDHQPRVLEFGGCLAVNPGSLYENQDNLPLCFALYDPFAHAATLHTLDGGILNVLTLQ